MSNTIMSSQTQNAATDPVATTQFVQQLFYKLKFRFFKMEFSKTLKIALTDLKFAVMGRIRGFKTSPIATSEGRIVNPVSSTYLTFYKCSLLRWRTIARRAALTCCRVLNLLSGLFFLQKKNSPVLNNKKQELQMNDVTPSTGTANKWSRLINDTLDHMGLSQKEFAPLIKVSQQSISGWVNGHRKPNRSHRKQIIQFARSTGLNPQAYEE